MCTPGSIPVFESISAADFRSTIQPTRRPAILRGMPVGPCVPAWADLEHLKRHTPNGPVRIHVTTHAHMDFRRKNFQYGTLDFHTLLERASRDPEEAITEPFIDPRELYYLRSVSLDPRSRETVRLERDFPDLAHEFRLPEFFPPDRFFSSVLRVSSPGVRVWTHYDVLDNVYVQVVGRKRAVMWAPSDALNLYLDGDKSRVVDIDQPDLAAFPKFAQATPFEGWLEPGDILFIPAMWFHNMTARDFGVAVNVFWQNLDQGLYDRKDPYGNRDLLPGAKALRMLDNVMKQLEELPEDLKDFYGRQLIARIEKKCLLNEKCPE
ncbi:tRNA wybutosine-synthesizing protein 5-like [Tigriopus californicus]|uniref:tRNA wybutosine-synthesizing protein 5-like n=1 Tax=Tigriopus californicus TaxID=6832 RepID=UPI0027DA643F|nr:tRNA wybutosine-synthesizing protein 5-like [Tigriopus californicus]